MEPREDNSTRFLIISKQTRVQPSYSSMKKVVVLLGFSIFTTLIVSFRLPKGETKGEALYTKHCKSCHGKNGDGGLFNFYPPLTDAKWVGNDTLIVSNIVNGLKGKIEVNGKTYDKEMPKVEGLSDAEIAEIINYVRITFADVKQKIKPEEVKKLRKL